MKELSTLMDWEYEAQKDEIYLLEARHREEEEYWRWWKEQTTKIIVENEKTENEQSV